MTTQAYRRHGDHADRLEREEAFRRAREDAEQHPCERPPRGCGVPAGETCRVVDHHGNVHPDVPLGRQPAHMGRLRAAGWAPGSTVGTGARRDTDRPDTAPIPRQNAHLYDDRDDRPIRHPDEEPML